MSSSGRLVVYESDDIPWDDIEPLLSGVDGDFFVDDVRDYLETSKAQLWAYEEDGIRALLVTRIEARTLGEQERYLLLWICSGEEMDKWKDYLPVIEAWAESEGCDSVEICGRRGWLKHLDGFHEEHVVFRKQLCPLAAQIQ